MLFDVCFDVFSSSHLRKNTPTAVRAQMRTRTIQSSALTTSLLCRLSYPVTCTPGAVTAAISWLRDPWRKSSSPNRPLRFQNVSRYYISGVLFTVFTMSIGKAWYLKNLDCINTRVAHGGFVCICMSRAKLFMNPLIEGPGTIFGW